MAKLDRVAGRPTKLDDLVSKRIVDALAAGVSRRAACEAARVSQSAFTEWQQRARDGEEPFASFLARVEQAEARAECKVVDRLVEAIDNGHVPAMMFWLERRRGKDWAKPAESANRELRDVRDEPEGADLDVARSVVAALESKAG